MTDARKQLIDEILAFSSNTYRREFLDGPHPQTGKAYSNAELTEYLVELQQSAAKPVRKQTAAPSAEEELYRQEKTSFQFLSRHIHDFNNCAANIGLIKDYFEKQQLEWNLTNLEKAFLELKSILAPVRGALVGTPQSSAPEPPPSPVPVVPVVQPVEPSSGLSMAEIDSWDASTMRKKMQNPVTRKEIDRCLAAEAELQRLARQQDVRQTQMENR